ncbi:AtzE family amidohydrolase [Rhizosaccharibacter radicis]|uniref:AtzE family amidohydrolase n=1 Tax=Rhizosaccharibacter radicis TaxID=2782605 RepID=A0ABT1VW91_9PROT|nr:AtzE family amidohydrolase [Acetobacteraceae bacterium KSS12]
MNALPAEHDANTLAAQVRDGTRSAGDVVRDALDRIRRHDAILNCFTLLREDEALAEADAVDRAIARGQAAGPLSGVPFAVKNLFDVTGVTTIAGSSVLAGAPPAPRDADAVARLRRAGAVLLGCLNMDEFAYGFSTENAHHGDTANPHDPSRIAGGSSGGSAAAVAAGFVPLSLGSDTNGSIRVPASLCGVYGLKPTFGRLSRRGAFPFVHSLDHVGPFARTVRDLSLCYDLMQGSDPEDPAQARRAPEPATPDLEQGIDGSRVALLGGWFRRGASAQALRAADRVAAALGAAETVELPDAERARSAAFCLTGAEGGALHRDRLATDMDRYDPAVRDRLLAGLLQPAGVAVEAQRLRSSFRAQARDLFGRVDLLVAPATPFPAVRRGQATIELDGQQVPARANMGLYTQPISFIGLPALSVPVLDGEDLPIGVQIIGRPWDEALLLRAASALERAGIVGCRTLNFR